jgi:site-specific recombinase XerD
VRRFKKLFHVEGKHLGENRGELQVKKSHPRHYFFNAKMNLELAKARAFCLETHRPTVALIEEYLTEGESKSLNYYFEKKIGLLEEVANKMRAYRYGQLRDLLKQNDLLNVNIDEINNSWTGRLLHFFKVKCKYSPNTVNSRYKMVKAVVNLAIKDRVIFYNPFEGVVASKEKSKKTKLTKLELEIFKTTSITYATDLARDVFMMQYYMRGRRVGDIIKLHHDHIKADRVEFIQRKTDKIYSAEIIPAALFLIEKYRGASELGYVFPYMTIPYPEDHADLFAYNKMISAKTSLVNNNIKKIAKKAGIMKKISSHVARHTFAKHLSDAGIALNMISQLLDHGDIATTAGYIDELNAANEMDDAVNKIYFQ